MIKIEKIEKNLQPTLFIVSETEADKMAKKVCKRCEVMQDVRDSVEDINDIESIDYILNAVSQQSILHDTNFKKSLSKRLGAYATSYGFFVNGCQYDVKNAEYINIRYIKEIAEKLKKETSSPGHRPGHKGKAWKE